MTAGAFLAVLILAARLLAVQGFVKPVRLASGSMAPTFLGPRYELPCGDCGFLVQIDATQARGDESAVCSNCGFGGNDLTQAALRKGERVLIDRGAYWLRRPRRFEAAAFWDPAESSRLAVKRLVGLPGETVEIRGGELYINGQLARKSLEQLRAMAVPVHDDRFRPADQTLPPRWGDEEGYWARAPKGYQYPGDFQPHASLETSPQFSWLAYRHWRCSPLPGLRTKESPVLDDYGYNLGPPRQLNLVSDLMLRCRVKTIGEGCLAVLLDDGRERFELRLWPRRGEAALVREGREIAAATFPRRRDEHPFLLEAALCDCQVLAAIDGRTILAQPYESSTALRRPTPRPLAFGAAGLAVEASELTVLRDIFYLPPPGRGSWTVGRPLAPNEYLLLGDNVPISQDSRTWAAPVVSGGELLGRVVGWPFAQTGNNERTDRR